MKTTNYFKPCHKMEKQEDKNKMKALDFKLEVVIRPSEGSNSL